MDYEKAYKASLKTAAQWIKDGCTDKEKICLECVFPELRESEDERIRMKLFHTVRGTPKDNEWFEEISKEAMLAWLEKQKEPENTSASVIAPSCWEVEQKENPKSADSFTDGIIEVRSFQRGMEVGKRLKQKEQKPIQTYEEKEYIRTLKSLISDFIRDKQPADVAFYQKIYDWLDGRHVEQKPAEWSEEDEAMIKSILFVLESYVSKAECEQSPALTATYPTYYKEIDWLKSLRPQYHGDVTMTEAYKMGLEAGKASSWKPSEDEERLINTSIAFLKYFADQGYENAVECIDWLKTKLK